MAARKIALTNEDFARFGQSKNSDDIALDGDETATRWSRDLARLALYGYGRSALETFTNLRTQHAAARAARPSVVADKTDAVHAHADALGAGWTFVDRGTAILLRLSHTDPELATALADATPRQDEQLDAGIAAIAALLDANKSRLPADAQIDARLAEVPALRGALADSVGTLGAAKARSVADTAALDLLDGKLYVIMRDLNQAARRAIRNGDLLAAASEYRFHHLSHRSRTAPSAPPAPPAPGPGPIVNPPLPHPPLPVASCSAPPLA